MHAFTRRRGFTLIELLVVIGIIGVVLSILLPALGGGIRLARRTASLSNLHSIGQFVQLYTSSNADTYPWSMGGVNACGIPVQFSPIWQMSMQWPLAMYGIVEPAQLSGVLLSPGARRDGSEPVDSCGQPPSYTYSQSFLANPRVWNGDDIADESMLGAVTLGMVAYPAKKALMWDWELSFMHREPRRIGPDLDESTPMLFADGHGADRRPSQATEAVENPFVDATRPFARLHNTPDGVRGWDY